MFGFACFWVGRLRSCLYPRHPASAPSGASSGVHAQTVAQCILAIMGWPFGVREVCVPVFTLRLAKHAVVVLCLQCVRALVCSLLSVSQVPLCLSCVHTTGNQCAGLSENLPSRLHRNWDTHTHITAKECGCNWGSRPAMSSGIRAAPTQTSMSIACTAGPLACIHTP